MLADSHLHLFPHGYHPASTGDGQDLVVYEELRQRHGIAGGLVVGYEGEGIDPDNNAYLRSLAAGRDWMTTVGFVPVTPAPSPDHLQRLLDDGHRGISLYCSDRHEATAVAGWPADCWRVLAAGSALVSVNASVQAQPPLAEVVRAAPGCRFLFSHLGLPGWNSTAPSAAQAAERLRNLLALAPCGNCWVKISGLYAIRGSGAVPGYRVAAPFVGIVLDTFGIEKCLWGSDFSPCLDHGPFEETLQVPGLEQLSAAERDLLMGGNLLDVIGSRS